MQTVQINNRQDWEEHWNDEQALLAHKKQVYGDHPPACLYQNNLDMLTDTIHWRLYRPRVYE